MLEMGKFNSKTHCVSVLVVILQCVYVYL